MIYPWLEAAWQGLADRLAADRMPHALLIHGPAGLGKRELAQTLARAALCEQRDERQQPCGRCPGCTLAAAGSHPDLHGFGLEEDSRQIRIHQVRELSRKAALTSSRGRYQVFVVDPADRMNTSAANALLKTLEEPRAGTLIILVAESRHRLPVTIRSRCQAVTVDCPRSESAMVFLESRHSGGDSLTLERALRAARGAPLAALALLEEGQVDQYQATLDELSAVGRGRTDPTAVAAVWVADAEARLAWVASALTQAAWRRARGEADDALTGCRDLASLSGMIEETNRVRQLLDTNLRPELLIESLLVRWKAAGDRA